MIRIIPNKDCLKSDLIVDAVYEGSPRGESFWGKYYLVSCQESGTSVVSGVRGAGTIRNS